MARRVVPGTPVEPYYAEVDAPDRVVVSEQVTEVSDGPGDLWPWLAGLGLALLLVVGYFALRDDDSDAVVVPANSPTPVATVVVQQPPAQQAPPVIINQPPAQQAPPQTVIVQQPPQQQSAPASQQPAPSAS